MTIRGMDGSLRKGLADLSAGRYKSVHSDAIEMIRSNVADPVPYYLLAKVALDHRNFDKAGELFKKACSLEPENPRYLAGHAELLVTIGRQAEALKLADSAVEKRIDDAFTADTIGVVFSRTGFHERAVPLYQLAVELEPQVANFHYNLGASLQFAGEFAAAEAAYRSTLQREPDSYRAYSALVSLSKQSGENNYLDKLEALFELYEDDPDKALHIGHAIAKTLEDLGRFEDSFDWLIRAKRGKRNTIAYQPAADEALFAAAAETARATRHDASKCSDASPIFIVGLPRTGTTLVDRILSSHPDVVSAGELNTFAGLIKGKAATSSRLVLDPETLRKVADADLAEVGKAYIEDTSRLARGAVRFTDKMPLNFFYVSLIHRALPNARIVALRRGALDSCLSNFRQLFATGFSYYNYSLDIDDTGVYYTHFDALMSTWRDNVPASRLLEIRYEDIVRDQENQTRRLLDFCGLSFNEACLRFHENDAPVATASSVQVRKPLYTGSIGRWKRYGDRLHGLRNALGDLAH